MEGYFLFLLFMCSYFKRKGRWYHCTFHCAYVSSLAASTSLSTFHPEGYCLWDMRPCGLVSPKAVLFIITLMWSSNPMFHPFVPRYPISIAYCNSALCIVSLLVSIVSRMGSMHTETSCFLSISSLSFNTLWYIIVITDNFFYFFFYV
jgi:hypothetical protein